MKFKCETLKPYSVPIPYTEGCIGIDDTDKKRSKSTRKISYVHKIKHKPSGGYVMGQSIVFLVLITPKITIPVGFAFHMPDPGLKAWSKNNKKLKEKGVTKKERPANPIETRTIQPCHRSLSHYLRNLEKSIRKFTSNAFLQMRYMAPKILSIRHQQFFQVLR